VSTRRERTARPPRPTRSSAGSAGAPILVIGGSQGIGRAVVDRWPDRATSWTRSGGVDATDPRSLRKAFPAYRRAHGAPWALLHCVGDFAEAPLLGCSEATYRHLMASNADSAFHAIQAIVPAMVDARRGGRVVLFAVAGVDRDRGMRRAPVYFAAKAAVVQLARALALEVAPAGITVNVIAPGLIEHAHSHRASQRRMAPRVPLGRTGTVADVVGMVDYLLSPAADYVTGQVLTVDGGLQS
jgi:NAD(P)-dependent dehydrogenase (short-subunit alcohol dehydrogenase family)